MSWYIFVLYMVRRAGLYMNPFQKHRSSLEGTWYISCSFLMGALATLGKSGLLTKACTWDKKEILERKVSLKEDVKSKHERAGVKGRLRILCDFLCAFSCRKPPLLSFCIVWLTCNPCYPDQTASSCLVSTSI